jgi:DNA-binding IclR family transcriptional regulator
MTQVREFRAQGYGVELGEANEHAGCVAAPVVNAAGKCIAAISVVAPEIRLQEDRRERLIVAVIDAAATLSSRLGAL